jgi:glutathione S-transferase
VILYELHGLEDRRYSLFSWRSRLALAHKGIEPEFIAVRISDKQAIAFSGQEKVPILRDGDEVIVDSWRIAEHLEARFPERASLFGGASGKALTRFVATFVDRQLLPKLAPMVMLDVTGVVDAEDGAHLRRQIETAFKRSLEELASSRDKDVVSFRRLLDPARVTLRTNEFLAGPSAAYADYALFSLFQWTRLASSFELLEDGDPLAAWRSRMLDLFGGLARSAPARASVEAASG